MRIEFLGSGTSQGVPEILCDCEVCTSTDSRDQRLRSSLWIQQDDTHVIIDVTPDFRQQCLRSGMPRLDAILLTHLHADHFLGMDDVRRYNRLQKATIPVFLPHTMETQFRNVFGYALQQPGKDLYRPQLDLQLVDRDAFTIGDLSIRPVPIDHGCEIIRGYIITCQDKRLAYLSDCKALPDETMAAVEEADVVVLGTIWDLERSHPHHLNLTEALDLAALLRGKQTYLTHITHLMGLHSDVSARLPETINLASDGLVLDLL